MDEKISKYEAVLTLTKLIDDRLAESGSTQELSFICGIMMGALTILKMKGEPVEAPDKGKA